MCELNINQFIELIRSKSLVLSDFYAEHIKLTQKLDREYEVFEAFDENLVLNRIRKIQDVNNKQCGRLMGVPIGVKDVINTAQLTTQRGSAYWKGYVAGNNARIIDKLEAEDGVVLGKTITAELGVHHPGSTKNPHNIEYSSGTSSMGSAVAVSAGIALAALGTQTGSSIIRPASYTGIYGFKPSYGVIPRTGVLKTTDTLDHVGFFANHIEGLKLLFDVFRVRGRNYPVVDPNLNRMMDINSPMRIGILRLHYLWKGYQNYVIDAFEDLVRILSKADDIDVQSIDDHGWFDQSHRIHETLYDKNLAYYFKRESQNKEVISSTLASMIDHGNHISVQEFQDALSEQERMQAEFDEKFEKYDLILTPSTANIAPLRSKYKEVDDTGLIWSLLGVPSINVPVFKGPDHMPFGLQAIGVKYSDYRVMKALKTLCDKSLLNPQSGVKFQEGKEVQYG